MSSAGHILDMINRSRYNDSIRKKRVERMRDMKDVYKEEIRKHNHIDFQRKDIDKKDLELIKAKIRRKTIAKERRAWVYTSITTVLIFLGLYYLSVFILQQ